MSVSPPEVVFAFAPKNGYFFEYKDIRKWKNIPKGFLDLLEGRKEDKVKKTFSVAFAHGVWVCVYENEKGEAQYKGVNIPNILKEWLDGSDNEPGYLPRLQYQSLKIYFGASSETFFATAVSASGVKLHIWHAADVKMERTFQRLLTSYDDNIHRCAWKASFGTDDIFLLYQSSEEGKKGGTGRLDSPQSFQKLVEEDPRGYTIVLNPFVEGEFFKVRRDGTAEWRVNASYHQQVKTLAEKILQGQSVSGSTTLAQASKRPAEEDPQADAGGEDKHIKIEKE